MRDTTFTLNLRSLYLYAVFKSSFSFKMSFDKRFLHFHFEIIGDRAPFTPRPHLAHHSKFKITVLFCLQLFGITVFLILEFDRTASKT